MWPDLLGAAMKHVRETLSGDGSDGIPNFDERTELKDCCKADDPTSHGTVVVA